MATRDSNSTKNINRRGRFASTAKRFQLKNSKQSNRGTSRPTDTTQQAEDIPTHSSHPVTSPTSSIFNHKCSPYQPPAQNFSSRNSLRTAKTFSTHSQHQFTPFTMPNINDFNISDNMKLGKLVGNIHDYRTLSSEYFLVSDRDTLVCLLCAKREKLFNNSLEFHLSTELHNRRYCDLRSLLVQQVPDDTSLQMNALQELLNTWYMQQSLTNEMISSRISIIDEFNFILNKVMPGSYCRVLGSMMTGTPLRTSDINLELVHPNSEIFEADSRSKNSIHHELIDPDAEIGFQINKHSVHYDLISNPIDTLFKIMNAINSRYPDCPTTSFKVISNINDLNAKVPKLLLRHDYSKTNLQVCCYSESSHKLAVLLRTYLSLDARAPILSVLVKYWARICKISNPEHGTYPPDVFIILVIYYLQRTSPPILPCLHELLTKNSKAESRHNQTEEVPVEKFKELDVREVNPKAKKANASIDEHSILNNLEVKEDNLDNPLEALEDGTEEELDDEEEDDDYLTTDSDIIKNIDWVSLNDMPIHKLFLNFLLFMSNEFNDLRNVISIRTLREVPLKSKRYVTSVKAIEHPVRPKINMSCCVGTFRTFEYIKKCFTQGYQYLTCLPLDRQLRRKNKREGRFDPCDFVDLYIDIRRFNSYYSMKKETIINGKCKYSPVSEMIRQKLFAKDIEVLNDLVERAYQQSDDVSFLPGVVAKHYQETCIIPDDVSSSVVCWMCKGIGHTRKDCKRGKIESLANDFENYDIHLDIEADLDPHFVEFYMKDIITPELSRTHKNIVGQLERLINAATGLNCKLQLFGSTVNNLGSVDSDLDICLTLEGNLTGKEVDCVSVLSEVHSVLLKNSLIHSVEPILSARVPIIKFKYSEFDVDLSMYNQCAIYNSQLLKAYSEIDTRVAQLFYLVKRYAKACKIADASRGSLSSYAWSLLVIHFLQNTAPPTLPVLQELPNGSKKPTIGVSGWNVWFNDKYIAPPEPENRNTLTELFKGFFLYYSCFDFNQHVVSIRKAQKITRFQKNWNNCAMAIEDPFELTYNLASRLDEAMAIYIINSFAYAFRNIVRVQSEYRDRIRQNRNPSSAMVEAVFINRFITNSNPPYRGCRVCHRIGHKVKDCPEKNTNKNQNNNSRSRTKTT